MPHAIWWCWCGIDAVAERRATPGYFRRVRLCVCVRMCLASALLHLDAQEPREHENRSAPAAHALDSVRTEPPSSCSLVCPPGFFMSYSTQSHTPSSPPIRAQSLCWSRLFLLTDAAAGSGVVLVHAWCKCVRVHGYIKSCIFWVIINYCCSDAGDVLGARLQSNRFCHMPIMRFQQSRIESGLRTVGVSVGVSPSAPM